MRMYELTITDPSGMVWYPSQNGLGFVKQAASWGASFSSLYTPWQLNTASSQLIGNTNPSALNVEFDLPMAPQHTIQGPGLVRVWGLGVQALAQAANLNPVNGQFKTWALRAGMAAGLPLANPSQAGILAGGNVYQAFGNWEDTNQTLDIILQTGPTPQTNTPISLNWQKGQNLSDALTPVFSQAFPAYQPNINIGASIVAPTTQTGCYINIGAFAKWLLTYTKKLGGANYPGVAIFVKNNAIYAVDGQGGPPATVQLAFQDLVGQPTWIAPNTISFATVMRGDIDYNDEVTFPVGTMSPYVLTQPGGAFPNSPAANSTSFSGSFKVSEIHHYANFREPDASSWATVFTAILASS